MMRARLGTDSVPGSRLHTCGKLELVIVVCLVTTNTLAKLHDGKKERHLKIIAIGDNVVDLYPADKKMFLGGHAANTAAFATMMGLDSAYLGTFGNDARGDFARRTLIELGVDLSHSLQYDGPNAFTTMKITTGKRHQTVGEPVQELQLSRDDIAYINTFDLVYLNNESGADAFLSAITAPTIYDFSTIDDDRIFKKIAPQIDLAYLSGKAKSDDDVEALCRRVAAAGCQRVVCSRGLRGSAALVADMMSWQQALGVKAVDALGAGDAYITCFAATLYSSQKPTLDAKVSESLSHAAKFASAQVQLPGSFGHGAALIA